MGLNDVLKVNGYVINNSNASILDFLPPELISRIDNLVTLLKITGIVIIAYIAFLIIRWFFSIRRHRKISKIYRKVYEIDRKLDFLLRRKQVKEIKKPFEKKDSLINRLFNKKHPKPKKSKK